MGTGSSEICTGSLENQTGGRESRDEADLSMPLDATQTVSETRSLQKGTRVAPMSKQERTDRFRLLSEMGCCICGQPPQIHHLIGTKWRGMGQKADDRHTIPLCMKHHTGEEGIHRMGMRKWESYFGSQESFLEIVSIKIEMLKQIHKNGYVDPTVFEQDFEQNQ